MKENHIYKNTWFAFFLSLFLCLLMTWVTVQIKSQSESTKLINLAAEVSRHVADTVSAPFYKAHTMASNIVKDDGHENFQRTAPAIADDPMVVGLLVAPDGVVEDAYPRERNKSRIGENLLEMPEALRARETGKLVMTGMYADYEGRKVLQGFLPVRFLDEDGRPRFWGMVAVIVAFPEILGNAGFDSLDSSLFCAVYHEDQLLYEQGSKQGDSIVTPLTVHNVVWEFHLGPLLRWYQYEQTWLLSLLSLLVSLLVAVLTQKNESLRRTKKKLEASIHSDNLTGVYNRQGLFHQIDRLIQLDKRFLLYFIDLDDFKFINDKYGHSAGDLALQVFCQRLDKHMDGSHLLGRVGGDEFVLVHVDQSLDDKNMKAFWDAVALELQTPVQSDTATFPLSFSMGVAKYPLDGFSVDVLMQKADAVMYHKKRQKD